MDMCHKYFVDKKGVSAETAAEFALLAASVLGTYLSAKGIKDSVAEWGIKGKAGKSGDVITDGGSVNLKEQIQELQTKTPQQLINDGWKDITDSRMAENTNSLELYNPKTGLKIRFDKGIKGKKGFEGVDHYHIYNNDYTNKKKDYYFDIDGNPTGKGTKSSHIIIGGKK